MMPLDVAGRGSRRAFMILAELLRHRNRPALAIDADEDELRTGDEGVVSDPSGRLPHGEAGAPVMGKHLLKAKHVTRERGRPVVDDGLPQRRPGAGSGEHIHAGTAAEHLPAGPLEQAEERGLVEVPERVAFVRIDDEIDLGEGHGSKIGGEGGRGGEAGEARDGVSR